MPTLTGNGNGYSIKLHLISRIIAQHAVASLWENMEERLYSVRTILCGTLIHLYRGNIKVPVLKKELKSPLRSAIKATNDHLAGKQHKCIHFNSYIYIYYTIQF